MQSRFVVTYDNFYNIIDRINDHLSLGDIKEVRKSKHGRYERPFYGKAEVHHIEKEHKHNCFNRDEKCLISLHDKYSNHCMPIHEGNIVILNQHGLFVVKNDHGSRVCKTHNYIFLFDFTKWVHILGNLHRVLFDEYLWYEWYENSVKKQVFENVYEVISRAIWLDSEKIENQIIHKTVYLPIEGQDSLEIRLTLNVPGFIQDGVDCKDLLRIEVDGEIYTKLMDAQYVIYDKYFRHTVRKEDALDLDTFWD